MSAATVPVIPVGATSAKHCSGTQDIIETQQPRAPAPSQPNRDAGATQTDGGPAQFNSYPWVGT
jgi:hypothetical protein